MTFRSRLNTWAKKVADLSNYDHRPTRHCVVCGGNGNQATVTIHAECAEFAVRCRFKGYDP